MKARVLLYGVDEFAGGVISRRAAERGFAHIAAGRDIARVATLANMLSRKSPNLVEPRIFGLGDKSRLLAQLDDVAVLVNCYPQKSDVTTALLEACMASRTNYLDLSSKNLEIEPVFELESEVNVAGISVIPGVCFDVSAADTLASRLSAMLPNADRLTIAISRAGLSKTEAQTLVEACRNPGKMLQGGALVAVDPGSRSLNIDFGQGEVVAYLAPWRCESLIARRQGPFQTVDSFEVFPPALVRAVTKSGLRRWMFRRGMRLGALARKVSGRGEGPSPRQMNKMNCVIWGEATDPNGHVVRARLETPAAHIYTADATLLIARALIDGKVLPGLHFPSAVGSAGLVENITGVHWRELPDVSENTAQDVQLPIAAPN